MSRVLIIGSGAREHAIAEAFTRSSEIDEVIVSPGNAGINQEFKCLELKTFSEIVDFVNTQAIDYVFVGNEQPLAEGIVDYLEANGIKVIGPSQQAAQIESSKVFSKNLMKKYQIPTADYQIFNNYNSCLEYLKTCDYPIVLKADGLAAGKGVIITLNRAEAEEAIKLMMLDKKYGEAGNQIVVEEFLEGEEASVFAFSDGKAYVSTIFAQDHKAIYDYDKGPNTGGMGAFAPVDKFDFLKDKVDKEIFTPILRAMREEGYAFKGVLFAGLMIKGKEIKVIEFNCRLGDPETEVILPLLRTDFDKLCRAILEERIADIKLEWKEGYAVTVVAASKGYPEAFEKGFKIVIEDSIRQDKGKIFFAGVKANNDDLLTNGGRVLCATGFGKELMNAISESYKMISKIEFSNKYIRKDIAQKGLSKV